MTSPPPPPRPHAPRTSWKLIVAIVGGIALCLVLAVGVLFYAVFTILRGSEAAKLAVQTAEADSTVAARTGVPLKVGRFVSGNINETDNSGAATLEIPIAGPKGDGTLYAEETREAGVWHIQTLDFGSNGQSIRRIFPPPQPGLPNP